MTTRRFTSCSVCVVVIASVVIGPFTGSRAQDASFRRGDANTDGVVELADALRLVGTLFLGDPPLACEDAADSNDSGRLDVSDAPYVLNHLFLGAPPPPEPGPGHCGRDPTEDSLDCAEYSPDDPGARCIPPTGALFSNVGLAAKNPIRTLALEDVDRNGTLDLLLGTVSGIELARGRGDGSFQPTVELAARGAFQYLTVADVNGDGYSDICGAGAGSLWVLAGSETGEFGAGDESSFDPEIRVSGVRVADVDGDQDLDAVVLDQGSFGLTLESMEADAIGTLLNQGDGSFVFGSRFETGVTRNGVDFLVGDVTNDGAPDVLVTGGLGFTPQDNVDAVVTLFRNLGEGQFDEPVDVAQGAAIVRSPSLVDVDGDGWLDLLAAGAMEEIVIALNNGNGTFVPSFPLPRHDDVRQVLAVLDLNSDGAVDLLATGADLSRFITLASFGDGTFDEPRTGVGVGGRFAIIGGGDLDGDDLVDVVGVNRGDTRPVTVVLGQADGTYIDPNAAGYVADGRSLDLAAEDIDGDGNLDLVVSHFFGGGLVNVVRGTGTGEFLNPEKIYGDAPNDLGVALAGLRGPEPDLIIGGDSLEVLFHGGNGDYSTGIALDNSDRTHLEFAVGDLDGDNELDVVSVATDGVFAVRNRGDGRFDAPAPITDALEDPSRAHVADLNGDGLGDVVVSVERGGIYVIAAQPDLTFAEPVWYRSAADPHAIVSADLDADGALDVLVARPQSVVIFMGIGDGTLERGVSRGVGSGFAQGLAVEDLDGDGLLDVLVTVEGDESLLAVLRGGEVRLEPAEQYLLPLRPGRGLGVGDFDGDGDPDVAYTAGGGVSVLFNSR